MSVDILTDADNMRVCLFDDTNMLAFGPVISGPDCVEKMAAFVQGLADDPRSYPDFILYMQYVTFTADPESWPTPDASKVGPTDEPPPPAPADTDWQPIDSDGGATAWRETPPDPTPPAETTTTPPPAETGETPSPTSTVATESATVPTTHPLKETMPVGGRECWVCTGSGIDPENPSGPCWQCGGRGWLPG